MGSRSGMPCTTCPHPTCPHSLANMGVLPCPDCTMGGTLVLDPVSAPKWRLDCNRCNFLIYLPPNLHSAKWVWGGLCWTSHIFCSPASWCMCISSHVPAARAAQCSYNETSVAQ